MEERQPGRRRSGVGRKPGRRQTDSRGLWQQKLGEDRGSEPEGRCRRPVV